MNVFGSDSTLMSLVDWLPTYTYPVVLVGTLIDASGFPFPGRLLLVAAGALAGAGDLDLATIIALGALGAMLMDHVWYAAAVRGSSRVIAVYRRVTRSPDGEDDAAIAYVSRYRELTIVLGRFFTSLRLFAWPVVASRRLGYPRFLVCDLVGASLWASIWVLCGWFVGERWKSVADTASGGLQIVGIVVVVAVGAPIALAMLRRRARATH